MDVLLTGADIVTMAAGAGLARSMLIRDDRIVAAGPAERVHAAAAPGARVVRLERAAAIPPALTSTPRCRDGRRSCSTPHCTPAC